MRILKLVPRLKSLFCSLFSQTFTSKSNVQNHSVSQQKTMPSLSSYQLTALFTVSVFLPFFFFLIIGNWQANSVSKVDVQMPSFPLWKLFLYLQFISTLFYSTNLYCSEISQYLLGSLMSQITF